MYTYRRYALYLDHHNVEAELAFAAAGARAASFERVTMLREPLSRFFSLYAYLWSDPVFGKTSRSLMMIVSLGVSLGHPTPSGLFWISPAGIW